MEIFALSLLLGTLLVYFIWACEYGYRRNHECDIDHDAGEK